MSTKTVLENTGLPYLSWRDFLWEFKWGLDEHVLIIGHTGAGKTTICRELALMRKNVAIFVCKIKDPLFNHMAAVDDFIIVPRWPNKIDPDAHGKRHIILWPPGAGKLAANDLIKVRFKVAMDRLLATGNWVIVIDELLYFSGPKWLGLSDRIELHLMHGRGQRQPLVLATARAANVPLLAYDQISHLFAFAENDKRNAETEGDIVGYDRLMVRNIVMNLDEHDAFYTKTRTKFMCITRAPAPPTAGQ